MSAKIIVCSLIGLLGLGCCKKQQPDSNQGAEVVWTTPLTDRLTSSMNPIIYNQFVIYSAYDSSSTKHKVIAFNKETGHKVWEWKNTHASVGYIDDYPNYVKDNILVLRLSGSIHQVVAIDLNNGSELWYTRLPEGAAWQMVGINNMVFNIRSNSDRMKEEIFRADIRTGHWQSVYAAVQLNAPIFISGMHPYEAKDEKKYLAFLVSKYKDFSFTGLESTIFKYSLDSNKIIYEKKIEFVGAQQKPVLAAATSDKFWIEGAPVYVLDETTMNTRFEIHLPQPEVYSGNLSVIADKVFMPRTQTLHCYESNTGKLLWTDDGQSSGSTSRFQVHQGKVYFASGGDGRLHAFDATNGKRIWKVESPDKKQDPGGGFSRVVTIDPTTNKLYTATYVNAICYKTAD